GNGGTQRAPPRAFHGRRNTHSGAARASSFSGLRSRSGPRRDGAAGAAVAQGFAAAFQPDGAGGDENARPARAAPSPAPPNRPRDDTTAMNYAIGAALVLLVGLLTLVSYMDRLFSEIGKFLSREFQDNIDAFELHVEPRLGVSRLRASLSMAVLTQFT